MCIRDSQSSLSRQEWENDTGRFDNLATQVMNFSYVIWHQQKQEEKGGILTYSQTFLPGLDEKIAKAEKDAYMEEDITYEGEYELPEQTDQLEMMHEAQSQIEELGRRWEEMYERYNGTLIRYMVTGPDGQCLRSNVIDAESVFSRGIGANEIRFTAEFASGGRLSISDIAGDAVSYTHLSIHRRYTHEHVDRGSGTAGRTAEGTSAEGTGQLHSLDSGKIRKNTGKEEKSSDNLSGRRI